MKDTSTLDFFLRKVERWCRHVGLTENALALRAINKAGSSGLFNRARAGSITMDSINRVEAYMEKHPDGPPL